jgi:hypothetical protein
VPLAHTIPLPRLDFTDLAGKARRVDEFKGRPVLLNLCSGGFEPCVKQLEHWAAELPALQAAGIRIFVAGMDDTAETRALLARQPATIETGLLTAHARERLANLYNLPFEIELQLSAPCSFLLDQDLRLLVLYRGAAGSAQLLQDVKRATLTPEERDQAAAPFNGVWFRRPTPWAPLEFITNMCLQKDWDAADAYLTENRTEFFKSRRFAATSKLLADALINENLPAKALPHYRDALAEHSSDPVLLNNLAHCLLHATESPAESDVSAALTHAEKAVALTGGKSAALLDTLAHAQFAAGKREEARATVASALALGDTPPEIVRALEQLQKQIAGGR